MTDYRKDREPTPTDILLLQLLKPLLEDLQGDPWDGVDAPLYFKSSSIPTGVTLTASTTDKDWNCRTVSIEGTGPKLRKV